MGKLLQSLAAHRKFIVLLGLTATTYVAAINRAQPLAWAIAALLSATLIAGFAWPRRLLGKLHVHREGPSRAAEGETIQFRVRIANSAWLPRFMVEIVDRIPFAGANDGTVSTGETPIGLVAYLPGKTTRHLEVPVVCEKRGYYRLGPVGLATSFPLGLNEARRLSNGGVQTLTIYPNVFTILALPLHGAPSQIHRGGYLLPDGAGAAEFCGLREYRRGDNPRHIHWPTTARLNELMVREYEPLASACLCLALDQAASSNLGQGKHSTFEYAVRIAASIARTASSANMRVRAIGSGDQGIQLPAGSGAAHYGVLLDAFAVVDCSGHAPYATLLAAQAPHCLRGETMVVFLSEADAASEATLQALTLLRMRQVHILAIVFDRSSFSPPAEGSGAPDKVISSLLELGAHYIQVRRGDDLQALFNQ